MRYVKRHSHIFGPVPSRRLRRSLGVDVVPFKTCTFDCIYCQLGRTTNKTIERREWVPLKGVIEELRIKIAWRPDYITIAGSGEPTLYSRIGELIEAIRSMTEIPVAVITNGSLLWQKAVRDELRHADVVLPSLDTGDNSLFRVVNRPHTAITFERLIAGLAAFRQEFQGKYWLEILLLTGYTAMEEEVKKIKKLTARIKPDKVHLNTCVRPPAEDFAYAVDWRRLVELADLFTPPAEVIADFEPEQSRAAPAFNGQIRELLQRRPCTIRDIATGLGLHPNEAAKEIERLLRSGLVLEVRKGNGEGTYYRASRESADACRETDSAKEKTGTKNP